MRKRVGKSNTSSAFKGVRKKPQKNANGWRVQIHDGKKTIHLGQYDSEVYAAKVYDAAAETLFGKAAYLNYQVGQFMKSIAVVQRSTWSVMSEDQRQL
tara:strand:+ start:49 stop:342 length:294 start_codon:yes stop_codon:yes gene_type:complete